MRVKGLGSCCTGPEEKQDCLVRRRPRHDERTSFCGWKGKAKNRASGLHPSSKKCREPGASLDDKGNQKKFHSRLTLVSNRSASIHAQDYVVRDNEIRKGGQDEVDRSEAGLGKEASFVSFFCTCVKP